MRPSALLALLLAISAPALAQDGPSEHVTVVARVTEITAAPLCGDAHLSVLVRMEVVSVASGAVPARPLSTYWDCGQVGTRGVGRFAPEVGRAYLLELQRHAPMTFGDPWGELPGSSVYYAVAGRPAR